MLIKEFGSQNNPTIILFHGGGLSWWSISPVIEQLKEKYHIVTPIIDGHGEDFCNTFVSIEDTAKQIISYINKYHGGQVELLGGLSIGAQICCEVLTQSPSICKVALIESALLIPIKGTKRIMVPAIKLSYGLVKKKWFSKLQMRALLLPDNMFDTYYNDSIKMTKESLCNITLSNGKYRLKPSISKTTAKVLIFVGGKEISVMKKSAKLLNDTIATSKLVVLKGKKHGELSLQNVESYVEYIEDSLEK